MYNASREHERIVRMSLERREILEALVRQGIVILSKLKRECRLYEEYQEARMKGFEQGKPEKAF